MGLFSWKCAITGKSIPHNYGGTVRLILPNEQIIEGFYNGYGRVGEHDVFLSVAKALDLPVKRRGDCFEENTFKLISENIKIVLSYAHGGQKFSELKVSEDCPYQGFFYPKDVPRSMFPIGYWPTEE